MLRPLPMFHRAPLFHRVTRLHCVMLTCLASWLITVTIAITGAALTADTALAQRARIAPEAASGYSGRALAVAENHMVSAANPLAVEAGLAMLRKGGSAVDAAIATQLVLNLVEPQSSGIGGGAFLVHWNEAAKDLTTYDGRERAPMSATPGRFLRDGKPMPFMDAVKSGLSVGVPGLVRMMEHVHKQHGKLPWADLFQPAIQLATDGFEVSLRLSFLLRVAGKTSFAPAAQAYFFDPSGAPLAAGTKRTNLPFAATLRAIAEHGADAFYTGTIAGEIIRALKSAPRHQGDVTARDLAAYRVVEREPVCQRYRGYNVCGMGPPSSGALTVAQTLALIAPFPGVTGRQAKLSAPAMHLIVEAQKLAYADRNRYIADPDFVAVPSGLLNPRYIDRRRRLLDPKRAAQRQEPGRPPGAQQAVRGRDATREAAGTSHISVIDGAGNVVSMTTTIESAFGSGVFAGGFLLNNELTDFSFRPVDDQGRRIANAVGPGKRPRSSMAPTIVFAPDGKVFAALGSPGGSRIILYVTKALVGLIDWKLDPQAASELINFGSRGRMFEIELEPGLTSLSVARLWSTPPSIWYALRLKPFGHQFRPDLMTSGLHIVVKRDGKLYGGADPRREGVALGD